MTETQWKKRLKELAEKCRVMYYEMEEAKDDLSADYDDIVPYEGRDELTAQHEEKQEWLDNIASEIDDGMSSLDYLVENLEEQI